MYWKKFACLVWVGLLVIGFSLPVSADDETDEVEIKVQATLDAVDCLATPPIITVLGLKIDISKASINSDTNDEDNENSEGSGNLTCADLTVGQVVEVKLASDIPDATTKLLSATKVEMEEDEGEDAEGDEVEIEAPLQAIDTTDPNVPKVTVLGLIVDISHASIEGADDEDNEGNNQSVDVSQLIVGQFVELELSSKTPPLVATELEVKNFSNQVEVEVVDENGNEVDDGDVNDIQVNVQVTPAKGTSSSAMGGRVGMGARGGKKVVRLQGTTSGSFSLAGLPTGKGKIVLTRVHNGQKSTGSSSFTVQANMTQPLRISLKPARR